MIRVAVVGATGMVGQQAILTLENHPWFIVTRLLASERSAGKPYAEALRGSDGASRWSCPEDLPESVARLIVEEAAHFDATEVDLVFSTVDAATAKELEPRFARTTPVISTASAFRYEPDTPILVGGVNLDHAALLSVQQQKRSWKGFIAPKPNCTTAGLVISLKPILDTFGVRRVVMTSLQAMSGAGRSPGLPAMDLTENVVPYIPGEEPKAESEPQKILGTLVTEGIQPAPFGVSATCTRVPVLDGHLVCAVVETGEPCTPAAAAQAMAGFGRDFCALGLPSSPKQLIAVTVDPFRPQPRLDRERGGGMTVTVGRLRADSTFDHGLKYVCLAHNTKLGAAKGALQTAEYLVKHYLRWL